MNFSWKYNLHKEHYALLLEETIYFIYRNFLLHLIKLSNIPTIVYITKISSYIAHLVTPFNLHNKLST
jgi:hypothetical protein